jgi:hypothetical protein
MDRVYIPLFPNPPLPQAPRSPRYPRVRRNSDKSYSADEYSSDFPPIREHKSPIPPPRRSSPSQKPRRASVRGQGPQPSNTTSGLGNRNLLNVIDAKVRHLFPN